jgi:hypothetical protein
MLWSFVAGVKTVMEFYRKGWLWLAAIFVVGVLVVGREIVLWGRQDNG